VESDNFVRDDIIEGYLERDDLRADPYPLFQALRARRPVYKSRGHWLVSRHADVLSILTDARFVYGERPIDPTADNQDWESLVTGPSDGNLLLKMRQKALDLSELWIFGRNPPAQTRLRGLVRTPFTREKLQALIRRAQELADGLLEGLKGASKFDVVEEFAFPLTLQVITGAIGIPTDLKAMRRWARDVSGRLAGDRRPIDEEKGIFAIVSLAEFLRKTIAARGNELPGGLLDFLVQSTAEGKISRDEVLANCASILVAGHATTQHTIASGVFLLLKHPAQLQLLRENPAMINGAVEEVLRYEAPLQRVDRIAQTDVTINGETIRKGERAILLISSANRDPELCSDPERFDITRAPVQHLSFGFGMHFCIGATLARMEAAVALGSLLRHFPRLRLESDEPRWEKRSLFRGLETLPVFTD
jgi:pimeloyl-[acyl-carrier protein] synthase